ncbi:hypothetical protein Pla22_06370 [Rubripirellula amarantea]|uniref:Lipoprotein n=1 Tax=Rubripirellula amarantea TaxID=2527999 RepID=A0A5C5WS71_9BACT|nr:hypothetical protein [Rubripirellula amarantea]TWT53009.1 hypothetical protein Pla22_06370 [Rubripirellula amarantea]
MKTKFQRFLSMVPILASSLALCLSGCSALRLPSMNVLTSKTMATPGLPTMPGFGGAEESTDHYVATDGAAPLPSTASEMVYFATRQAKTQGGIVLHVEGAEPPVRVLPLPEDGRGVYVSQLISQSGVDKKLGSMEATLFRHTPSSINGMPMDCKMTSDGRQVRPESDYALQPGDRLRVRKSSSGGLSGIVDLVLAR